MSLKLTIHPLDVRLVPSDIDMAVGGIPPNLERTAKLVKEGYIRNNDEAGLYTVLGLTVPAGVAPRDHAQMRDVDTAGNAQTGPGIAPPAKLPPVTQTVPGPVSPNMLPSNVQHTPGTQPVAPYSPPASPPLAQPSTGLPPGFVPGGVPPQT